MKKSFAKNSILLSILTALSLTANAGLKKSISKKIKRLDLKTSLEVIDSDNLGLKYNYKVQPSFIDNMYSRVDEIQLDTGVSLSQLIDTSIGARISTGSTITVVRQFSDHAKAVFASPTGALLKKVPTNSKIALEEMEPGDFVSFKTYLNLVVGKSTLTEQGIITAGASAHYLLAGEFDVRVYRMQDNKVRLQLLGVRKKEVSFNASVHVLPEFDVFSINKLNRVVEKKLNFTLVSLSANKGKKDLFMVDYTLDLNDKIVQKAYNATVSATTDVIQLKKKRLSILNPLSDGSDIRGELSENIVAIESLRVSSPQKVTRHFRADNEEKNTHSSFGLGLNIIRLGKSVHKAENNFSLEDNNGYKKHYYMPIRIDTGSWKFFFGWKGETDQSQVNMLFRQDSKTGIKEFVSRGYRNVYTDKQFEVDEQEDFRTVVETVLPAVIAQKINWAGWDITKSENQIDRKNVRLESHIQMGRPVLAYLVSLGFTQKDFEQAIYAYYKKLKKNQVEILPYKNPEADEYSANVCQTKALRDYAAILIYSDPKDLVDANSDVTYANSICKFAKKLSTALNPNKTTSERVDLVQKLSSTTFYRKIGMSFLLNMLPEEIVETGVNVKLHWSSAENEALNFQFGQMNTEVYESVLTMQSILLNRIYDVNIIAEALGK